MKTHLKNTLLLLLMLACSSRSFSQDEGHIGSKCENLALGTIVVSPASTIKNANLYDYKGKLVIFDFGNLGCHSCIRALPAMNAMQEKFGSKIQIFWVCSPDSEARVKDFLQNNPIGKTLKIPVIAGNAELTKYFQVHFFPKEIWIAPDDTIRGFTPAQYVDSANIAKLLSGQKVNWPVYNQLKYDYKQGILTLNSKNMPQLSTPKAIDYSVFTGHLAEIPQRPTMVVDSVNNKKHYRIVNYPVLFMYAWLLSENHPWTMTPSRALIATRDSSKFFYKRKYGYEAEWDTAHRFCYEFSVRKAIAPAQFDQKVLNDLNYYTGLNAQLQTPDIVHYELVKLPAKTTRPGSPAANVGQGPGTLSVEGLLELTNLLYDSKPCLNKTRLTELQLNAIRVKIPNGLNFSQIETMRHYLNTAGFDLKLVKSPVEMLVIKDTVAPAETLASTHN